MLQGCVAASFMVRSRSACGVPKALHRTHFLRLCPQLEVQAVPSQPPHALRDKALERVAALRSRVKRLA